MGRGCGSGAATFGISRAASVRLAGGTDEDVEEGDGAAGLLTGVTGGAPTGDVTAGGETTGGVTAGMFIR